MQLKSCKFEWKFEDMWVGLFWKHGKDKTTDIWICFLPCVPLHIVLKGDKE